MIDDYRMFYYNRLNVTKWGDQGDFHAWFKDSSRRGSANDVGMKTRSDRVIETEIYVKDEHEFIMLPESHSYTSSSSIYLWGKSMSYPLKLDMFMGKRLEFRQRVWLR